MAALGLFIVLPMIFQDRREKARAKSAAIDHHNQSVADTETGQGQKETEEVQERVSEPKSSVSPVEWIEPSDNEWGIKLLDLRPVTKHQLLAVLPGPQSEGLEMAQNSLSYFDEDGTSFVDEEPEVDREIDAEIYFRIDPILASGVLFTPSVMEHKWAIFFHHNRLIFVQSWLRRVMVTAETVQENGRLLIYKIKGCFFDNEEPDFTRAVLKFLLISHVIAEDFPAPLPHGLSADPESAMSWAMSMYGKIASFGTFMSNYGGSTNSPIYSNTLLHIGAVKGDLDLIDQAIESGIPIGLLGTNGQAALHWSLRRESEDSIVHLIKLGADVNIRGKGGVTPLMVAAHYNLVSHMSLLLNLGAEVNACEDRGFTALHMAAENGYLEGVELLLKAGADPSIEAMGYNSIAIAKSADQDEVLAFFRAQGFEVE
jgi:hypothetical protein